MSLRTRYVTAVLALIGFLGSVNADAQINATQHVQDAVYCGCVVTTQPPNLSTYVISGPESEVKDVFSQGNYVFINKGSAQGVKVGDEFLASRPETEQVPVPWFKGQIMLMKAMGTYYADLGRIKVVSLQQNTSVAEVTLSCDYIQRGDVLEPFSERPVPTFKSEATIDRFAAPNGKPKATIVFSKQFGQMNGTGTVVYVNLGSAQGVKIGDYFRVFRYQSSSREELYEYSGTADRLWGFGSTPVPYSATELPRDVIGEGVVLRIGPNAATVILTNSTRGIFVGDYVEVE